jgi:hypothetical protein
MATKKKNNKVGMDGYKAYDKLANQSAKEGNERIKKLGKMLHAKSTSLADAKKLVKGVERFLVNEYRNEDRNIEKTADRLHKVKKARAKNK